MIALSMSVESQSSPSPDHWPQTRLLLSSRNTVEERHVVPDGHEEVERAHSTTQKFCETEPDPAVIAQASPDGHVVVHAVRQTPWLVESRRMHVSFEPEQTPSPSPQSP